MARRTAPLAFAAIVALGSILAGAGLYAPPSAERQSVEAQSVEPAPAEPPTADSVAASSSRAGGRRAAAPPEEPAPPADGSEPGRHAQRPASAPSEADQVRDDPAAAADEDADADGAEALGPDEPIVCRQPALDVPRTPGCARGLGYPSCRWGMPRPRRAEGLFSIWRNTTPDHRSGRPGLVSLILATAAEFARRWPSEQLTVGDLDAPGPRHATHRRGVDVDLYLPHAMMARNERGGRYPDNYADKSPEEVRRLRAQVLDLAKILAVCAGGQVRIYYNDPEIIAPFLEWFEARGLRSQVGPPMVEHNDLHRFHFHLTVPEDLEPLPLADEDS